MKLTTEEAVSNAKFETASLFDKGDRQISGRSVVLRPEGVYEYVERKETAVEKDHLKRKKSGGFQPISVSFATLLLALRLFYFFPVFFGLTKCDSPFFVKMCKECNS